MPDHDPVVYSTQYGRHCPDCGLPVERCACSRTAAPPPGDGVARVGIETKGRGGKVVTVVRGLRLTQAEMASLTTRLKKRCGCGGALKDWVIELQGDRRDEVVAELTRLGHRAKKAGG